MNRGNGIVNRQPVFIGIDVACAKGKRLPVCVAYRENRKLIPIDVREQLARHICRGPGNREILAENPFVSLAGSVASALDKLSSEMHWQIERIAIDAPASPPQHIRKSEQQLSKKGWSSFSTPRVDQWEHIKEKCSGHLNNGGELARLPEANKIWMIFGFELFTHLRATFGSEVIEVYPSAIVLTLLKECPHKSTQERLFFGSLMRLHRVQDGRRQS